MPLRSVITDRGLAETRISDIAERAGVSPGLILYYFESKDRLLVRGAHVRERPVLPPACRASCGGSRPRATSSVG